MNFVDWNQDGNWSSAKMRLKKALGYGDYELSIKVGKGSGVTTTFYLSERDRDQYHEIDLEFSGHCTLPNTPENPCGTACVQTNVWQDTKQFPVYPTKLWSGGFPPPVPLPDNTQGWGFTVYRYKITWDQEQVSWWVDCFTGNGYILLRSHDISKFGYPTLLYPFISFWTGWTPDGSPFLNGQDATAKFKLPVNKYGNAVDAPCYQAFYFQSLKFTPSKANKITKLVE